MRKRETIRETNNMDYKVQKDSLNNDMASLVNDVCNIIETGRKEAYIAAGKSAVITSVL